MMIFPILFNWWRGKCVSMIPSVMNRADSFREFILGAFSSM
jgi:hypothetical protein